MIFPYGNILISVWKYPSYERAGVDGAGTAEAFVVSCNLHRRHLNESQRAMIAAKYATLSKGDVRSQRIKKVKEINDGQISPSQISAGESAEMLNVNRTTVVSAKTVIKDGSLEWEIAQERRP